MRKGQFQVALPKKRGDTRSKHQVYVSYHQLFFGSSFACFIIFGHPTKEIKTIFNGEVKEICVRLTRGGSKSLEFFFVNIGHFKRLSLGTTALYLFLRFNLS